MLKQSKVISSSVCPFDDSHSRRTGGLFLGHCQAVRSGEPVSGSVPGVRRLPDSDGGPLLVPLLEPPGLPAGGRAGHPEGRTGQGQGRLAAGVRAAQGQELSLRGAGPPGSHSLCPVTKKN